MRFASTNRRSTATWLWGFLGVLAWLVLTSLLNSSPASAADRHDGEHGTRATHSSASHGATPKPRHSDEGRSEKAEDRRPDSREQRSDEQRGSAEERDARDGKRSTPRQPAKAPSKESTTPKTSNVVHQATSARDKSSENRPAWAHLTSTRDSADKHRANNDARWVNDDLQRDKREHRAARDKNQHRAAHGKNHAFGDLWNRSRGSAHHAHRAQQTAHDVRDTAHSAGPGAIASDGHNLAPAPPSAAQSTNVTATEATVTEQHRPRYEPLPGETPGGEPVSAPATSGAVSGGVVSLQITAEVVTATDSPSALLLGVCAHADEHPPSAPTTSTDCSPD